MWCSMRYRPSFSRSVDDAASRAVPSLMLQHRLGTQPLQCAPFLPLLSLGSCSNAVDAM